MHNLIRSVFKCWKKRIYETFSLVHAKESLRIVMIDSQIAEGSTMIHKKFKDDGVKINDSSGIANQR